MSNQKPPLGKPPSLPMKKGTFALTQSTNRGGVGGKSEEGDARFQPTPLILPPLACRVPTPSTNRSAPLPMSLNPALAGIVRQEAPLMFGKRSFISRLAQRENIAKLSVYLPLMELEETENNYTSVPGEASPEQLERVG